MERVTEKNINTKEYWDDFDNDGFMEADRKRGGNICRFSHIVEMLVPNADILDVGCLNGNLYNFIEEKRRNIGSFTGIDLSDKLIERAKQRFPDQKWQVADCYSLPFEDNSFDVVTALEVMEHIEEPKKMLAEMMRVTRSNGSVIITTPNNNFVKDAAHIWSFSATDVFNLLSEISKNVQVMKICSTDRYILARAIIDYSSNLPT